MTRPLRTPSTGIASPPRAGVRGRAAALVAALLFATGCASTEPGAAKSDPSLPTIVSTADSADSADSAAPATLAEQVEQAYVIGPAAARALGYRVDWQFPARGIRIKRLDVQHDSVFALDEMNVLTRLRREDGSRVWRLAVAKAVEAILGVTYVPSADRVYLTTGSDLLVLDAASGARIGRQRLDTTANTQPVALGNILLYGSRNGQVVWHSHLLNSTWRAYQVAPSIYVQPVYSDGYVVAVGTDGSITCLDAESASRVWARRALAPIVATPVAGNGAVYAASLDHHLRAYELNRPRSPLWEYLTESPLRHPPTLVGDRVYQHVESEGLVCLEALPLDSPGGVVVWQAPDARGNVVTSLRNNLFVWDAESHRLEVVEARLGAVVETLDWPQVDRILATAVEGGELYASGLDGRIVKVVPR